MFWFILKSPADHLGSAALTSQQLEALRTLSYASDVELQRSAALCFLEISEKCTYLNSILPM